MPNWPPQVPFFSSSGGYSRTGMDGATIRTQMSAGPAKVRRRTHAAPKQFSGTTPYISEGQLAVLETFFEDDLLAGTLSFQATDPADGVEKTYRFVGTYSIRAIAAFREVSAELEILR